MTTTPGSIKNPQREAENPAPTPDVITKKPDPGEIKGPEKPTDLAGQQGGTHGGGRG